MVCVLSEQRPRLSIISGEMKASHTGSGGGHCYCHPHQNDQHISKLTEHLHIVDSPHSLGGRVISFLILKVEKPSEA